MLLHSQPDMNFLVSFDDEGASPDHVLQDDTSSSLLSMLCGGHDGRARHFQVTGSGQDASSVYNMIFEEEGSVA